MKNGMGEARIQKIVLFVQFWIGDNEQVAKNPSGKIWLEDSYSLEPGVLTNLRSTLIYFFEKVIRLIIDLTDKVSEPNSDIDYSS